MRDEQEQSNFNAGQCHRQCGAHCIRRRLLLLTALAFVIWPSIDMAFGADVVIVKTSEAEPYNQAEAAAREKLTAEHHTVRSILARDVASRGVATAIGQPDFVVAVGTPAAKWLHTQPLAANVKLTYCMVSNAEEAGLLQGRDCWGVTTDVSIADQMKLIGSVLPRAAVVGLLYRSDTPDGRNRLQSLKAAIPRGWRVEAVAVNDHPSVAAAIDVMTGKNPDVIWTTLQERIYDTAAVRALLLSALRTRTPVFGFSPAFVRAGGLVGVGVEPKAQGEQAAVTIMGLLADAKSVGKSMPPKGFQVAINLIVARQLQIEIPEEIVRRAAFVYRPEN